MAKKMPAPFGNFPDLDTLIDQFFVTIKIVIDELVKKGLHTSSMFRNLFFLSGGFKGVRDQ